MANEKSRDNSKLTQLMVKYPDWDWDYWVCQA